MMTKRNETLGLGILTAYWLTLFAALGGLGMFDPQATILALGYLGLSALGGAILAGVGLLFWRQIG